MRRRPTRRPPQAAVILPAQALAGERFTKAFSTAPGSLGDVSATALVRVVRLARGQVHTGLGASLPTGSIDARDDTPLGRTCAPASPSRRNVTYGHVCSLGAWGAAVATVFADLRAGERVDLSAGV